MFKTSINKSGDLKIGRRKCRLLKKPEIRKVAEMIDVPNVDKKTKEQLCRSIRRRAMKRGNLNNVPLAHIYKNKIPIAKEYQNNISLAKLYQNKIPLAKLYPGAAKRMAKKNMNNIPLAKLYPGAANRIAAARNVSPSQIVIVNKPKPKVMTLNAAMKHINSIKSLTQGNKSGFKSMLKVGKTPSKVVKLARELARLK